jgi:hypothetical protein
MKANWKSLHSENFQNYYLKSGQLDNDFKIRVRQVDNLIKVLDDLYTGNNTVHDIYEYKYLDNTYEMKFGHDIILDSLEAKESRKILKNVENHEKVKEREITNFVKHCADKYDQECKNILNAH